MADQTLHERTPDAFLGKAALSRLFREVLTYRLAPSTRLSSPQAGRSTLLLQRWRGEKTFRAGCQMKCSFILVFAMVLALSGCGGGGSGSSCNVAQGSVCAQGEYCAYLDGSCGRNGEAGSCVAIPTSCVADAQPVCTCDALSFTNECFSSQGGQSVQAAGECA
jgi:hypothetical protein